MVVGSGAVGSSGGGGLSTSWSVDGSGRVSSASTGLVKIDEELCRRIGTGDTGRCEEVDGFGCSSSSLSTASTARPFPFFLLGVAEARVVRPSSAAPDDRAREIRLQLFLDEEVVSGRAVAPRAGSEELLDFPTRPIMLLRIVDLRERFGTSDEATASSGEGWDVVEIW